MPTIRTSCPHCGHQATVYRKDKGRKIRCPHCEVPYYADAGQGEPVEQPKPKRRRSHFHCPFCDTDSPPIERGKISTGGWVVFVVLLIVFFPLCWIGLLMKEPYRVCSACGTTLG